MLLQGIQDGTLPADVETAALAAASSSTARLPAGAHGGTSLDRLVLNQLVTVLQATSTLTSGATRPASAAAGQDSSTQVCAPTDGHSALHYQIRSCHCPQFFESVICVSRGIHCCCCYVISGNRRHMKTSVCGARPL